MGYYKITSLTAKLPKRHQFKDKTIDIDYRDSFKQTSKALPVGGTLYISAPSLPVNLHKLRMKKLINVVEVSKNTFMKLQNPPKPKPTPKKLVGKWNPDIEQEKAAFAGKPEKKEEKPKKRPYKKKTKEETIED